MWALAAVMGLALAARAAGPGFDEKYDEAKKLLEQRKSAEAAKALEEASELTEAELQLFDGDGLMRRIANSIRKLVSAHARLNCRSQATVQDVEVAWDMLSYKLEVDTGIIFVHGLVSRPGALAEFVFIRSDSFDRGGSGLRLPADHRSPGPSRAR